MRSVQEIYRIIVVHSKEIRESLGDSKFIHGEIYADAVFGALLSAVKDNELRAKIVDMAFEKYRKKAAMCVSLEREEVAFQAMTDAEEKGIAGSIAMHLGTAPDKKLISAYLQNIKD